MARSWQNIAQLAISIESVQDNEAFYEAIDDSLKSGPAEVITEGTWLDMLFYDLPANVTELRESFGASDTVIRSVVDSLCASLAPSFRSLVGNFRVGLSKSVSEAFHTGFIGS